MKHSLLIFYFLSFLMSFSTFAGENYDQAKRWGLGLELSKATIGNTDFYQDNFDGKIAGSLWLRYHYSSNWAVEIDYSNLGFKEDSQSGVEMDISQLTLSAAYRIWANERMKALLQIGLSYDVIDIDANSDKYYDYGIKTKLGLEYMMTANLALGLHGTYQFINTGSGSDSELHLFSPGLALTYYFGGYDIAPYMSEQRYESKDTDEDGVIDERDKCPATPSGQKVTKYGCAKTEKLKFSLNVQFATGSSKINREFVSDLKDFAEFMKKYPKVYAVIEAHTDNTGSRELNMKISQARANSVLEYVTSELGLESHRLTAKGIGPDQPLKANNTAERRAKNRRVVANIMSQ